MTTGPTIAYLDCSTGVSGDKFLGALLDAGATSGAFTRDDLRRLLAALVPEGRAVCEPVLSHGIDAVSVRVEATEQPTHRHWRDIRSMLVAADLASNVRNGALAVFGELAAAEAAAHGCDADDVHFHEVGALDSILDVVGVCAGLDALGVTDIYASPVATGWGCVDTSHGVLPVPAPATAELLLGIPVVQGPARPDGTPPGELTTPTGAALLKALVEAYGPCPPLTSRLVGYGAGTRDIGHPNVCRLTIGEPYGSQIDMMVESVSVLESNIDHLSPEAVAVAVEQLLAEGALDAWSSPIVMKKGRSAVTLSVLVRGDDSGHAGAVEAVAERVIALTGTLGVRRTDIERFVAAREIRVVETPYGPVSVKVGPHGASRRLRPEADDVAHIARITARSFSAVERELTEIAEAQIG